MVVYHNDNSHLQEAPDNHCSTFCNVSSLAVSTTTLRQFSCIVVALLVMTGRVTMLGISRWAVKAAVTGPSSAFSPRPSRGPCCFGCFFVSMSTVLMRSTCW